MEIISHRGLWNNTREKNSTQAFKRSFGFKIGTETDIRDYRGELVISHDIELMARYCARLTLLCEGKVLASGTAAEVIQPHLIKQAYDCDVEVSKNLNNIPQIIPVL